MPLQNRVSPFGDLFADSSRGLFMGNRGGRIHRDDRNALRAALDLAAMDLLPSRFQGPASRGVGRRLYRIVLSRRGDRARRRSPALFRMPPQGCGSLRAIMAGALRAATRAPRGGDGPCAAGRAARWRQTSGGIASRSMICRMARASSCRATTSRPAMLRGDTLLRWTSHRLCRSGRASRDGRVDVLTPPSILAVLEAGYQPLWHPSADARADLRTGTPPQADVFSLKIRSSLPSFVLNTLPSSPCLSRSIISSSPARVR